jgi:hypothetical protein
MMNITIEISPGELVDRTTILRLKHERIADPAKLEVIRAELAKHDQLVATIAWGDALQALSDRLLAINTRLWDIEEDIRACERAHDFGPTFIALARAVYLTNDERAATKREIDRHLGSAISEMKSYTTKQQTGGAG